jgi:predicted amidohydrolase
MIRNLLTISYCQFDVLWEDSPGNIKKIENAIANIDSSIDLLVLPEMFHCGFTMQPHRVAETMDGRVVGWMRNESAKRGFGIMGSVVIKEAGVYYNRLVVATPDGGLDWYDKRHLFRMGGEHEQYRAGDSKLVVDYLGWKIRPLVCYDLRFPVWSRNQNDCDVLVYVANWPEVRAHVWNTLLMARAIENQCYVLGVNRVGQDNSLTYGGHSVLIGPKGEMLSKAKVHHEDLVISTIKLDELQAFRNKFPVHLDADTFYIK